MDNILIRDILNSKVKNNIKFDFYTDKKFVYKKNDKLIKIFEDNNFRLLNKNNIPKFFYKL